MTMLGKKKFSYADKHPLMTPIANSNQQINLFLHLLVEVIIAIRFSKKLQNPPNATTFCKSRTIFEAYSNGWSMGPTAGKNGHHAGDGPFFHRHIHQQI